MGAWTARDIPDQTGRTAIVTGANSGIGYHTALELARKGATVVLACRSEARGAEALGALRAEVPDASAQVGLLDLADLDSVRSFAETMTAQHDRIDLLVNNAGVMIPPLGRTAQGFELQFGINHLGHFALTGLLLPHLRARAGSRVVVVASSAHYPGEISFDDPNWEHRPYRAAPAYSQSKLANLLFARELSRRLDPREVLVVSAHPGWALSNLQRESGFIDFWSRALAQSAAMGSLPTLRAATDPEARADQYFGPRWLGGLRGPPVEAGRSRRARRSDDATRLWALSEELTGVHYLSEVADVPA